MNLTHTRNLSVIALLMLLAIVVLGAGSFAFAATGGPTVTLTSSSASTTNASSIPVTATFSQGVGGFTASDIAVTNGSVSNFVSGTSTASTTAFTFNVAPASAGLVTVMIPADIASSTASSTGNQASNTLTFNSTIASSTGSTTPLAITGVDAIDTVAIADGSFNDGWTWVIHFTVPNDETSFQLKFNDFTSGSSTIPAAGNIRYFSAQSSNAASADHAIVESSNNYGGALTLSGDTSTSTAGRQVDVTVQVAVPQNTPTGSYTTLFGARSTAATSTATSTGQ